MSKHECHCGQLDLTRYPCDVHQPPRTAFAWEPFGPHDGYRRRDQLGREVAYATRSGAWTTWFDGGIVNAPDVTIARAQADLNLYEHGLLLEASSCPVSVPR